MANLLKLNNVLTHFAGVYYERAKAIYILETYPHNAQATPRWYIVDNIEPSQATWNVELAPYINNRAKQTDWHRLVRLQATPIDTAQVPTNVVEYLCEVLDNSL